MQLFLFAESDPFLQSKRAFCLQIGSAGQGVVEKNVFVRNNRFLKKKKWQESACQSCPGGVGGGLDLLCWGAWGGQGCGGCTEVWRGLIRCGRGRARLLLEKRFLFKKPHVFVNAKILFVARGVCALSCTKPLSRNKRRLFFLLFFF